MLIKLCVFCFQLLIFPEVIPQTIPTAEQLLQNAIAYHDPEGKLLHSKYLIVLSETRPDGRGRESTVTFDYRDDSFHVLQKVDGRTLEYFVQGDSSFMLLDGSLEISDEDREKYRLRPNRPQFMRNYYGYLYGLPMKLRDSGTKISPKVEKTAFDGKNVYSLKITYEEIVGSDTWYFYFDVETFALSGYRFYHDESKNDGEYILVEGEAIANGVRLPKARKWYRHEDNKFLGTDTIVGFEIFEE